MRKFKLNKKSEPLKDQEIDQYKDFKSIRANYDRALERIHKKPLYRDPKMFFILVIIIAVAWIVSVESEPQESQKSVDQTEDTLKVQE